MTGYQSPRRILTLLALLILLTATQAATAQTQRTSAALQAVLSRRAASVEMFQGRVRELIESSVANGQAAAADELRDWLSPPEPAALRESKLPRSLLPAVSPDLPQAERDWRIQLQQWRQDLASELYLNSRQALRVKSPVVAWDLVREAAWYNSDHPMVRKILGFEQFEDRWVTPFEKQKLRNRFVWDDRFGWIAAANVARYENGERLFLSRWVSADKEAELRRDFRSAWETETDHYLVKTNLSLEQGVELARALERFHEWFQREFPEFFNTDEQLQKLFTSSAGSRGVRHRPFVVHFYRSKEEYVERLIKDNPQIEITNGIYIPDERVAHFYNDPQLGIESTLYHEATHQILYELDGRSRQIGQNEHFWIVEGFACYMETLRQTPSGMRLGQAPDLRLYWAQNRFVEGGFYVPFERLAAMGKTDFQTSPSIRELYSQTAGMAHFLMEYKDGIYRDALVQHLALLYRTVGPGLRVAGIDHFAGVRYEVLDQEYRDFISTVEVRAQSE